MKDGVIMKEKFCLDSERDRMEDCSLEMVSESFMIRRVVIEKVSLGDTREKRRDIKSRRSLFSPQVVAQLLQEDFRHQEESPQMTSRRL